MKPTFTKNGLAEKQKGVLLAELSRDYEELRGYLKLCRECPRDYTPADYDLERMRAEEAEEIKAAIDYLKGDYPNASERYFAGYLLAYARQKRERLSDCLKATLEPEKIKTAKKEDLREWEAIAKRARQLSQLLDGKDIGK